MSYEKIKHALTKHRSLSISLPTWLRRGIVSWAVPRHNETTLYILSISFMTTFWLSAEFRALLVDISEPNADGESGILGVVLFFVGALLAIIVAFVPNKIPGFRSFFAPAFIVFGSLFLALEYIGIQLDSGGFIGVALALYQGLAIFVLIHVWDNSNKVSQNISADHRTHIVEILAATLFTVAVFITTYYLTDWHEISWAIPVTMSLFLWQLFENRQGKVIRT